MVELRRYQRAPVDVARSRLPQRVPRRGRSAGRAKDISLGGMFVETAEPPAFGADVVVHVTLPGQKAAFALPAVVRWLGGGGMGVQFGLLGARETHAITELTRAP